MDAITDISSVGLLAPLRKDVGYTNCGHRSKPVRVDTWTILRASHEPQKELRLPFT